MLVLDFFLRDLESLPDLPEDSIKLHCPMNKLICLPPLPHSLTYICCHKNKLTSLPPLPPSLLHLCCSENEITVIPPLPQTLKHFECFKNKLTCLPTLPEGLTHLYCQDNHLISLPTLPSTLIRLDCTKNNFTFMPAVPFYCDVYYVDNPLIWCENVRRAPRFNLKINKVAMIHVILGKYYARLWFKERLGKYIDKWLDAPVTNDGKLGIRLRINLQKYCDYNGFEPKMG